MDFEMDRLEGEPSALGSFAESRRRKLGGPAITFQSKGPRSLDEDEVRPTAGAHSVFSRHPSGGHIPHGQVAELLT